MDRNNFLEFYSAGWLPDRSIFRVHKTQNLNIKQLMFACLRCSKVTLFFLMLYSSCYYSTGLLHLIWKHIMLSANLSFAVSEFRTSF